MPSLQCEADFSTNRANSRLMSCANCGLWHFARKRTLTAAAHLFRATINLPFSTEKERRLSRLQTLGLYPESTFVL